MERDLDKAILTHFGTARADLILEYVGVQDTITHRYQFDHYPKAYQAIEDSHGEYMKVMIELN